MKKVEKKYLPPETTEEQDVTTAGQRVVNLIWENTQSKIALTTVIGGGTTNTIVILVLLLAGKEVSVNQLAVITVCLQFINLTVGIVIGFYFSRTNHTKIGGVGAKPINQER